MVRYPVLRMGKPTPPEWMWLICRNCPYRSLCEAYGEPLCMKKAVKMNQKGMR